LQPALVKIGSISWRKEGAAGDGRAQPNRTTRQTHATSKRAFVEARVKWLGGGHFIESNTDVRPTSGGRELLGSCVFGGRLGTSDLEE
jgi:hypothetical protein